MPVLLERDAELELLSERLDRARCGGGGVLLVEGTAGIGKTSVLAAGVARASELGLWALTARGAPLEREFPFGVARQLLERPVMALPQDERAEVLAGAASLAGTALGVGASGAPLGPEAAIAALSGIYWLIANLADRRPLALVVDDVQWADDATLRLLGFLVPRLAELPVCLIGARRPAAGEPGDPLLAEFAADPQVQAIALRPLSRVAIAELLERQLGAQQPDELVLACERAVAGNPLLLEHLVAAIASGAVPTVGAASRIEAVRSPELARLMLARMGTKGRAAASLARALAVLGDGAELSTTAQLAELPLAEAAAAADALAAGGLLESGPRLVFAHPILRESVYGDLGQWARQVAHRRAAELLTAEGASLSRVAAQWLVAAPTGNGAAIAPLRMAAFDALTRGAPDTAVSFMRRALEEPPEHELRGDVLRDLGMAEVLSGDFAGIGHLTEALALTGEAPARGAIAIAIANTLMFVGEQAQAVELLDRTLAELSEADRGGEIGMLLEARLIGIASTRSGLALPGLARLDGRPVPAGSTPAERLLLLMFAVRATVRGERAEHCASLLLGALAQDTLLDAVVVDPQSYGLAVGGLMYADRLDEAESRFARGLERARGAGAPTSAALMSVFRSTCTFRAGRLADAEADLAALEPLVDADIVRGHLVAILGEVQLDRGELQAATATLAEAPALLDQPATWNIAHLLHARGRMRVAQRHTREALSDLLECGRTTVEWCVTNPSFLPWRPTAALAHLELGERAEAERLAAEEVELARASGAPRALGIALRAVGLVASGERRLELLRESVDALTDSPARLEYARSLVALGAALRRANRRVDARPPLREGLDLATRCGARPLAEQARQELRATGARPRAAMITGRDALTATERRVALMASEDQMTNREIAQALFVTKKTVETHLGRVYRKLDITSRRELARALAEPRD